MWRRAAFLVLLGLLTGSFSGAHAALLLDQPYRLGFGDRLLTDVYIDGQGPFEFLLDTASSQTVLYERVRSRLNLVPVSDDPITVLGMSGIATSLPFSLSEFRLSQLSIPDLPVVVLPNPPPGTEPDGVLGIDVLKRFVVVLDARGHRLQLYDSADDISAKIAAWRPINLLPRRFPLVSEQFWFMTAYYENKPARTLLDLGAGLTILNWELAHKLGFEKYKFPAAPEKLRDVLGKPTPVFLLKQLTINIAGRVWRGTSAVVADAKLFDILNMADEPAGIIGPGLLLNDSIAIDFQSRHLYIAPRERN